MARCSARSFAVAAGTLLSWGSHRTRLPLGFAALRMEAHRLHCWAEEESSEASAAHGRRCLENPVHLLCRALRMAPLCYRRFELAAACDKIHIAGAGMLITGNRPAQHHHGPDATFDSITGLAAAMLRYAFAEGLCLEVSSDERTIIVRRVGANCLPLEDAVGV